MNVSTTRPEKPRRVRISEIFYSIEGEGPLTGVPTVFVRTFGCNFTCSGFGNPTAEAVIPIHIEHLDDFRPTHGCDSIYAWHPSYKNVTTNYTIDELVKAILRTLPGGQIKNPRSGNSPLLSFTGGEPTLHQRTIRELLEHPDMQDFDKLLIETNCAVTLKQDFIDAITQWSVSGKTGRSVLWSNSPKLSMSGELRENAIRPDILESQLAVPDSIAYFKFVSDGSQASFDEIEATLRAYRYTPDGVDKCLFSPDGVYVMPVGATLDEQNSIQLVVAQMCLDYGYNFCARVHVNVFGNSVGT